MDIVERLRHHASSNAGFDDGDLSRDAADEIERLTKALHGKAEALMTQTNEVERLREDLLTSRNDVANLLGQLATVTKERDEYNTARLALIAKCDELWDERHKAGQERDAIWHSYQDCMQNLAAWQLEQHLLEK